MDKHQLLTILYFLQIVTLFGILVSRLDPSRSQLKKCLIISSVLLLLIGCIHLELAQSENPQPFNLADCTYTKTILALTIGQWMVLWGIQQLSAKIKVFFKVYGFLCLVSCVLVSLVLVHTLLALPGKMLTIGDTLALCFF